MNRNKEILNSFVEYCEEHPQERFWQALRNWSGWAFVCVSDGIEIKNHGADTFYFEEKDR